MLIGHFNARQKPGKVENEAVGRRLTAGVLVQTARLLLRDGNRRDFSEERLGVKPSVCAKYMSTGFR